MIKQLFISLSILLFFACKTAKTTNTILFENLISFIIRPDVQLTEEVNYFYFSNENDFRKTFTLTKGTAGNIIIPDFETQRVIAVALKPTKDIFEVKLQKTEITGTDLDVFYTRSPSAGTSFLHTPFTVASIVFPKSILHINFYNGKTKEKVLEIDSNN